jgi:hypothetical protein
MFKISGTKISAVLMIMIFMLILGCVELYDFKIENNKSSLVIEGQISNVSYNEFQEYPADGRHFSVRLSKTSDVSNVRDEKVTDARVFLLDDQGSRWDYTSSGVNPGIYILFDDDFHAEPGIFYQLNVILLDGESYQSDWEQIPAVEPGSIGNIDFEEITIQKYIYLNREKVLTNIRGVNVNLNLPEVPSSNPVFYRWTFSATWVFLASLVSKLKDDYRCWITNPYYLSNYVMHRDYTGGYKKKLFFLEVDGNDRIVDRISVLINQYSMQEGYYNYWKEIQEQDDRTGLFDPPSFNLHSNLHTENPDLKVFGYFGVVNERITRWNFSQTDLSYPVPNPWIELCSNPNILPEAKAQCYSCFNYGSGVPTNLKPYWWDE